MTDTKPQRSKPGDALRQAGIKPAHPGAFFARLIYPRLAEHQTPAEIRRKLGLEESGFAEFLAGRKNVDADLAKGLNNVTGMSAQVWLNMQEAHDGHATPPAPPKSPAP